MNITSLSELRQLYGHATERSVKKEIAALDTHAIQFIGLSPFVVLASGGTQGDMDASPRGGDAGFVKVLNAHTLLIPDAPGNNRLDTLENIVTTGHVGLLFMVPGFDETLRVNGRAVLETDPALLEAFRAIGGELGPSQVWKIGTANGMGWVLTSVRRSMSNLADPKCGALVKLHTTRVGMHGSREHLWALPTQDAAA